MKQIAGVWLPDHEKHLVPFLENPKTQENGVGTYQRQKLERALFYCRSFRKAVDIGGHVGLWSMALVQHFEFVTAFEPVSQMRRCFTRNLSATAAGEQCAVYPYALGNVQTHVLLHTTEGSSGDSWIKPNPAADDAGGTVADMKRLDDFHLHKVDFVKVDCEGYELFALQGGETMLRREKPCIIVEQKPGRAQKYGLKETEAVDWLQSLGAELREEISGDFILSWPDA